MKVGAWILGLVIALSSAAPAFADRGGDRDGERGRGYQQEDARRGRGDERGQRDFRDPRHGEQMRERSRNSLTPDERRQLRRDINDAGREIYRDRRGR